MLIAKIIACVMAAIFTPITFWCIAVQMKPEIGFNRQKVRVRWHWIWLSDRLGKMGRGNGYRMINQSVELLTGNSSQIGNKLIPSEHWDEVVSYLRLATNPWQDWKIRTFQWRYHRIWEAKKRLHERQMQIIEMH